MSYSIQWKNEGTSYGSTEVDFCKKNNINVYTPQFYLNFLIKHCGESGVVFEKNNFTYSLEEDSNNPQKFKQYERQFPTQSEKPEIAMVNSIGHIGILYYDGINKFYIDTGGILEEFGDIGCSSEEIRSESWRNKAWLEEKIKNEGYKYIRINCFQGVGGYKISEHENGGSLSVEEVHNISIRNPVTDKEKNIYNDSRLALSLDSSTSSAKCMPTSMALVAMFKQEGKLDLNKVIQGFNTEKILTRSKEKSPDMLDDNYSILDFKIEDKELHNNREKLSDNWLKDELSKIKMEPDKNFLSCFVSKIKNSFSR